MCTFQMLVMTDMFFRCALCPVFCLIALFYRSVGPCNVESFCSKTDGAADDRRKKQKTLECADVQYILYIPPTT